LQKFWLSHGSRRNRANTRSDHDRAKNLPGRSSTAPLCEIQKMIDKNNMIEFANDLEALLQSQTAESYIRGKYSVNSDKDIEEIMGYVEHFLSDSDIREKDTRYRQMQETMMLKLIQSLRIGDLDSAKSITFLE
jgi:hypothetical protein